MTQLSSTSQSKQQTIGKVKEVKKYNDFSPEWLDSSAGVVTAAGGEVRVLGVGRKSHGRSTFTSSVDLAAAEQGVAEQVRQPTVEVQRGQAALETFSGGHQLGQVVVHAWTQSCDEEVTWGQTGRGHRYSITIFLKSPSSSHHILSTWWL